MSDQSMDMELSHQSIFPIAIVASQFNAAMTHALLKGAMERLTELGWTEDAMMVIEVPGAVEIPLVAKKIAKKKQHAAIIALGIVVRGETSHYDYVCQQVSQGCQQVALEFEVPVIFGVLTTENDEQVWARLGGAHGHKGKDAVDCAITMRNILLKLE